MSMPGEEVTVISLVSGRKERAILLRCRDCSNETFVALLIGPGRDLHLQCTACAQSYCAHGSDCHQEQPKGHG